MLAHHLARMREGGYRHPVQPAVLTLLKAHSQVSEAFVDPAEVGQTVTEEGVGGNPRAVALRCFGNLDRPLRESHAVAPAVGALAQVAQPDVGLRELVTRPERLQRSPGLLVLQPGKLEAREFPVAAAQQQTVGGRLDFVAGNFEKPDAFTQRRDCRGGIAVEEEGTPQPAKDARMLAGFFNIWQDLLVEVGRLPVAASPLGLRRGMETSWNCSCSFTCGQEMLRELDFGSFRNLFQYACHATVKPAPFHSGEVVEASLQRQGMPKPVPTR